MTVATFHHISLVDVAIILGAIAYGVSLLRDWRPIRALRSENAELRVQLERALKRIDEQESQIKANIAKIADLEKSRDFSAAFGSLADMVKTAARQMSDDHALIIARIEQHEKVELDSWQEVNRALGANTAVLSTLATGLTAAAMSTPPDAGTKLVETREVSHVRLTEDT